MSAQEHTTKKPPIEQPFFLNDDWVPFVHQLKEGGYDRTFILVDTNTHRRCLPILSPVLEEEGVEHSVLEVDAGEASKCIEVCASLWNALTEEEATRKSLLINLGGGMITDLGGFVAATYKRGIDFINIPTSLLAMVDAAIGGKCGIDFNGYKNQLGAFQTAKHTFVFPDFLKSLPQEELLSGYAEVMKHALIADTSYWAQLQEASFKQLPSKSTIQQSITVKSAIVEADPMENGERKKLNFGHTVGHAIESYFLEKGDPIPHGYAVAAGMICEAKLSGLLLSLSEEEQQAIFSFIDAHYARLILPTEVFSTLIHLMKQDKKKEGHEINCTLLNRIGNAVINREVEEQMIIESLNFYCNS